MAREICDVRREVVQLSDRCGRAAGVDCASHRPRHRRCGSCAGVAPDNRDYGVMLPYAPLHHLLFARGRAAAAGHDQRQRSGEPLAYADDDACGRLSGIADAFLVGERPIARRDRRFGRPDRSAMGRRSCGARVVTRQERWQRFRARSPVLALGADLKNTLTLVVDGQAFISQYIGDLEDARTVGIVPCDDSRSDAAVRGLVEQTCWSRATRTRAIGRPAWAERLPAAGSCRIQHHRAQSRRCSRSARHGTSAWSAPASTAPATATMAARGEVSCSSAASAKDSTRVGAPATGAHRRRRRCGASPGAGRRGFPRAARRCSGPRRVRRSTFRSGSSRRPRCCVPAFASRRAPRWGVSSTRLPRCSASPGR